MLVVPLSLRDDLASVFLAQCVVVPLSYGETIRFGFSRAMRSSRLLSFASLCFNLSLLCVVLLPHTDPGENNSTDISKDTGDFDSGVCFITRKHIQL